MNFVENCADGDVKDIDILFVGVIYISEKRIKLFEACGAGAYQICDKN